MTIKQVINLHSGNIKGLEFLKDNRYLITGGTDKKIIMFDLKVNSSPYFFELFDSEVR